MRVGAWSRDTGAGVDFTCRVSSVLLCPTLSYYFMLVLLCPTFLKKVLLCPTFWDFSAGLVKSWAEVGLLK